MIASFTEQEKITLYGQSRNISIKHNCSKKYVNMIINNERNITTNLAKLICEDLRSYLEFVNPKPIANV